MKRTPEEEKQYQALTPEEKNVYDFNEREDPSLSHAQLLASARFAVKSRDTLKKKGGDDVVITPQDEIDILRDVSKWLNKIAPKIYNSLIRPITDAINRLNNLIERGIDWIDENIIDPIIEFLS